MSRLRAGLSEARQEVARAAKDMGDIADRSNVAQRFFRREQVTFALSAIGNAAQVTASLIDSLRTDSWERFVQEVERLPFGLGQVATGVRMLHESLTGWDEESARLDRGVAESESLRRRKEMDASMSRRIDEERARNMAARQDNPFARIDLEHEAALIAAERFADENRPMYGALADELAQERMTAADIERRRRREAEQSKADERFVDEERRRAREARERERSEREAMLETLREEEDRLRGMEYGSPRDFISTAQTALGSFSSGQAGTANVMRDQLATQRRLVEVAEEQKDILGELRSLASAGGWQ